MAIELTDSIASTRHVIDQTMFDVYRVECADGRSVQQVLEWEILQNVEASNPFISARGRYIYRLPFPPLLIALEC